MKEKIIKRSECPISSSLEIWGDKWSLLIIRDIIFSHKNTYGEFLKSPEKIATNILAARLLNLEERGVITKEVHPDSNRKVLYKLTKEGLYLLPVLLEIYIYADKTFALMPEFKKLIAEAKKDKAAFIKKVTANLKSAISH